MNEDLNQIKEFLKIPTKKIIYIPFKVSSYSKVIEIWKDYKKTKVTEPLITYEWFPRHAKFYLSNYDFPVFPEDFAYYLMKDNKTLIMVSAIKNINQSFKFDISTNKLYKYSTKGKLDFIISSITKDCGFSSMNDTYKCYYYKPLISQNLIN